MTHNRNKEDVNLLSSLTLSVFLSLSLLHCEWRETQRERERPRCWAENTLSSNSNNAWNPSMWEVHWWMMYVCSWYIHITNIAIILMILIYIKLHEMNANISTVYCFYTIAFAAWLYRWQCWWAVWLLCSETSQQLLKGLPWNFVQTFMFPHGWILQILVIPWLFH